MTYQAQPGFVYLVGMGPGDPGLVTCRARDLLAAADVVLYDRLIPHSALQICRDNCELINVGKTAGNHAMDQDAINQTLVDHAQQDQIVVRAKGGDPYLFGRGGEEAAYCRERGISFEVVPGVTSAIAASSAAGIPVTHRDVSRHVTIVTASAGRDGQGDPDYHWLAQSDGTVVLLMGLRRLRHVCEQLIEGGAAASRPAAVISHGTAPTQRSLAGTLSTLPEIVEQAADLPSPAIIVVGDVVDQRESLQWFEQRPLMGRTVVVTRARAQASSLVNELTALGAQVIEAPMIQVERCDSAAADRSIDRLDALDWILFTSSNGVNAFFDRLLERGLDVRSLSSVKFAVVGAATARSCRERGVVPDLIPPVGAQTGTGLLAALRGEVAAKGARIDVVRAVAGNEALVEGLESDGHTVTVVPVYETVRVPLDDETKRQIAAADLITFTAESTVRNLHAVMPDAAICPPAISIGPVTTDAARDAGFSIAAEAAQPSIASLVDAVLEQFSATAAGSHSH